MAYSFPWGRREAEQGINVLAIITRDVNTYNNMKYAKFKLLTRVIKGGKENSVLSWSQFPFRMSLITSGKGTTVAATYKIVEIIDVYGTFLRIPKGCMVNQCKSNKQKNPNMFFYQ